jgi:hypothetical protein
MNTKIEKRVLFFTGGETANLRSSLGLNRVFFANLKNDEYKVLKNVFKDKNRKNKKTSCIGRSCFKYSS